MLLENSYFYKKIPLKIILNALKQENTSLSEEFKTDPEKLTFLGKYFIHLFLYLFLSYFYKAPTFLKTLFS